MCAVVISTINREDRQALLDSSTYMHNKLKLATYMLDIVGKIFKRTIAEWLRKHFPEKRALSTDQYGFRAGHSTINVARNLRKLTALTIKKHQFAQLSAAIFRMHSIQCHGYARESKGAIIPLQHHFGLLLELGVDGANSIGHDKKRNDMHCPVRVSP